MNNFVTKHEHNDQISICFNIEADEVMAVGEKMEAINEEAYMNGYNWEAFLTRYLLTSHKEILNGLETDSEAGTYVALYNKTDADKANKLVEIIQVLLNSPDKIYAYLKENGAEIEWN